MRPPPRSTLFPSRRSSDLGGDVDGCPTAAVGTLGGPCLHPPGARLRSEEHTSELQSQSNLVCRLLLEKKNRIGVSSLLNCADQAGRRITLSRPVARSPTRT